MDGDWHSAIERAGEHSPFLAGALAKRPDLADLLAQGRGEEALASALMSGDEVEDVGVALRRERLALALVLAIGDLAGAFPLSRVMGELSAFADRALDRAIGAAIARRVPGATPSGLIALALGKQGARELNYSSDIDPILIYDPELLPRRERDEPGQAAQRYARDIVRLLSENTPEGYVFRVDLRLRPASEVSPLAVSLDAAISHYESSALAWERAAFIRARACAGDVEAGHAFLETIRPFVWRRSLDFGAIDEIRRLTARIRERYKGPRRPGPGFDVKQGRGGIREVEFFAQTHQLIHGGRQPELRVRGTRKALDALAVAGRISSQAARELGASYDALRNIEHRLQMVADRQTHTLPQDLALDNVAQLDGLANGSELVTRLCAICEPVASRYDALIDEDDEIARGPSASDLTAEIDEEARKKLAERTAEWPGRFRALRSPAAQAAFDAVRPELIASLAASDNPDTASTRWETLLDRLPTAINFFRLLEARPALLDLLVDCLTIAPPLADELARRPELLDALIDRTAFDLPGTIESLAAEMRRKEADDVYERLLDRIRVVTGEKRFALGIQLIEGAQDPLDIAEGLSRVAEAALQVATEAAGTDFARKHGRISGSDLLVLGLGRLGGGALTHASDLDIIFLYEEGEGGESDGTRPLGQTLYYNRLAQRVSAALSVPTAEGALYEVDTRLRPQGAQGPLAVGLTSFAKYQASEAWTWEHMALARARVLTGPTPARLRLERIISDVLMMERDPEVLRHDVLKMRAELAGHKPPRGVLDAKLLRGGLIDLEFLVHYLQLRERTCFEPDLAKALSCLAERGLLPEGLGIAHRLMTRVLVGTRLLAPDLVPPENAAASVLARQAEQESMDGLLQSLDAARQEVAAAWHDALGAELEIRDE
ncbi:MAG: bifunctional [glutamate--ammonia ligase]-adenylyl-L-tyrosine phosphorylase/[glutamate--ammonia-ligase] adenylyltransferase [Qipengyuania sp.]